MDSSLFNSRDFDPTPMADICQYLNSCGDEELMVTKIEVTLQAHLDSFEA